MPDSKNPNRRLLLLGPFAAMALVACGADEPSPATTRANQQAGAPAKEERAAGGAATTAQAQGSPADATPGQWNFSADDAAIGSEVGVRVLGAGMETTGKQGWLIYGPYVPLRAGSYEVALDGRLADDHAGVLHVDIAHGKGTAVVASAELDVASLRAGTPDGDLLALSFTLPADVPDAEVRVRVTTASHLSIAGYQIRSKP